MRVAKSGGALLALMMAAGCGQGGEAPSADAAAPAPSAAEASLSETGPSDTGPSETGAPAEAVWSLDSAASRVGFVSIKSGEVIETHYFPGLSGELAPSGEAVVEIPLDQVETKVDIRNERMREMFFETGDYPAASIRTTVAAQDFADLPIGGRRQTEIDAVLSLHGVEAPVSADVFVTRIAETRVEVASAEPVVLFLSDFNLEAGLEMLREVAGLPSIVPSSPVTFTFVFDAQGA
ncbi:MAG: YceI family protein [Pseudomonadota bacterium]